MKITAKISVVAILLTAMFFASCASSEEPTQSKLTERRDIPDFFLNPPTPEDQIVGLGMAKLKDDSLSRDTALARARADIARQVSTTVQSMLTDYAQEAGADDEIQTVNFIENVTKQIVNIQLNGAVTKKMYAAKDGTWYAMVYYPKEAILKDVNKVFTRNEDASFAKFSAQEATARLNSNIENNPPRSEGIDSPVNQD